MANWLRLRARRPSPTVVVVRQALVLTTVVASCVAAVVMFRARIFSPNESPHFHVLGSDVMNTPGFEDRCGPPRSEPFVVTLVHSPDMQGWLELAAAGFMKRCPNTQITLVARDDIDAAKAIAAGELKPTSWTPSDSLFLHYLDARAGHHVEVEQRPSLLRSPMVIVAWSDRLELLELLLPAGATGAGAWAGSACAGVAPPSSAEQGVEPATGIGPPTTWASWWLAHHGAPASLPPRPSLAELERWGPVEIRHASPTRSATGLLGLYLIALDFLSRELSREAELPPERADLATALEVEQLELQQWLRSCEAGQEPPPASGELLTESLLNFGDAGPDAVITDEHLALAKLARLDGREQALRIARVIYPQTTIVRDHPELQFEVGDSGEQAAARRFGDYLRERDVQLRALELGFRPTHPEIALDYDLGPNPFTRLRRYGVELEPDVHEPPRLGGASVATLIELWSDATGRS